MRLELRLLRGQRRRFLRRPEATNAAQSYVEFQPLGVVLALMPWNYPYWQVFRFAAPALMAGNTAVLKHASNVSMCALKIEQVFQECGFPQGVFRMCWCQEPRTGSLIADRRIAAVTLTGSEDPRTTSHDANGAAPAVHFCSELAGAWKHRSQTLVAGCGDRAATRPGEQARPGYAYCSHPDVTTASKRERRRGRRRARDRDRGIAVVPRPGGPDDCCFARALVPVMADPSTSVI